MQEWDLLRYVSQILFAEAMLYEEHICFRVVQQHHAPVSKLGNSYIFYESW